MNVKVWQVREKKVGLCYIFIEQNPKNRSFSSVKLQAIFDAGEKLPVSKVQTSVTLLDVIKYLSISFFLCIN